MSSAQIGQAALAPPIPDFPAAPSAWRQRARSLLMPLGCFLLMLAAWEAYVRLSGVPSVILPGPVVILQTVARIYPTLLRHALPTTLESAGGFLIACALGVSIAIMLCYSRLWREAVYPNLVFIQVIPKIALAPLFVLWFGLGSESRLAFSVFISVFPIIVSTYTGLTHVDPNLIRLCRTFRAREWQVFLSVRLPSALPFMFSGMKVAITLAIIGVVIGEFITSQAGLGYLIVNASARSDTPIALAAVTVLCASGVALYGIVAFLQALVNERYGREHGR
jgi:NitT/TauT family transport system permease protein